MSWNGHLLKSQVPMLGHFSFHCAFRESYLISLILRFFTYEIKIVPKFIWVMLRTKWDNDSKEISIISDSWQSNKIIIKIRTIIIRKELMPIEHLPFNYTSLCFPPGDKLSKGLIEASEVFEMHWFGVKCIHR